MHNIPAAIAKLLVEIRRSSFKDYFKFLATVSRPNRQFYLTNSWEKILALKNKNSQSNSIPDRCRRFWMLGSSTVARFENSMIIFVCGAIYCLQKLNPFYVEAIEMIVIFVPRFLFHTHQNA